ncbi:hypothetical protein D5086_016195 [Populus alba]|uniref:Uncharacterized protein n=1 Tax=Populus alba TaxID=43335 RepID=A0ACC4BTB4_POPAL
MEVSSGVSPRMSLHQLQKEGSEETHFQNFELGSFDYNDSRNLQFYSTSALEILRETARILRCNSWSFMTIAALLICPVSAILLSNVLVDQSIVKRLSTRLLLVAKSSGLPLRPLIKQLCHRFAEMAVSSATCFPLFITLSLLSRAAVVYSVDCTYSRKDVDGSKFLAMISKIWRRIVSTYLWSCMVIVGCLTLFFVLLVAVCSTFLVLGFWPELNLYAAMIVGLVFSVIFANAIIVCNIAVVISVLVDVSGPQALLRSSVLIRGQTQVGLLIFLGSTIGMAFIEGLFEHRVKTLSYGDGSSRIWEGPLLVIMYSFVVLIDLMMSAVFYYSCRSHGMEASDGECLQDLYENSLLIWKSHGTSLAITMQRLWLLLNSDESLVFCRNVTGMRNITFLYLYYKYPNYFVLVEDKLVLMLHMRLLPNIGFSNTSILVSTLRKSTSISVLVDPSGSVQMPILPLRDFPSLKTSDIRVMRKARPKELSIKISVIEGQKLRCGSAWKELNAHHRIRRIIMDSYIQEKIHKFEEFVDGHLKPQLVRAIAERDKVFEQQKIFSDLRRNIENLEKNSVTNLRTLVNLGSEVYMQADVPDTQSIFVDVGLGFHVEFTWTEALNFIALREEKIARQIEEYTRLISSIKARIKLVCEGIRELLQLPAEKALPQRVF